MSIVVKPTSRKKIIQKTEKYRKSMNANTYIDVIRLLEHICYHDSENLNIEVVEDDDPLMKKALAKFLPLQNKIIIRNSVYEDACKGVPRHRFTVAHELGHSIYHNLYSLAFARDNNKEIKAYEDPEWQANEFAGNLLLPPMKIKENDTIEYLSKEFGVSKQVAKIQISKKNRMKL